MATGEGGTIKGSVRESSSRSAVWSCPNPPLRGTPDAPTLEGRHARTLPFAPRRLTRPAAGLWRDAADFSACPVAGCADEGRIVRSRDDGDGHGRGSLAWRSA